MMVTTEFQYEILLSTCLQILSCIILFSISFSEQP
jgi:hypothetical protein